MYQNAMIQCPVCRGDMCFPETYSKESAAKALIPNLGLLQALLKEPLKDEETTKSPDEDVLNELYRLNVTDREARLELFVLSAK